MHLTLRGAREHNLRDVDLDLALGRWIAVTGPSGSGKTSLVFDTLVREGQRRYLGALSTRARQFLGKLGRAELTELRGLPVPIAVGQRALTAHARSTVGTLTGALDLLRLLFARQAVDPGGVALTRSHFSFNVSAGACEACQGLGVEDRVDPAALVADPARTIRGGALRPTLKSGYTVYSQVTVEVMDRICRAHGFDVDTPWEQLSEEQRHVVLYGTRALKVPFGKHGLESRMRWEGITARPREEGYYRGLIPVIEETLQRNRNANVLRFVVSAPCSVCGGSRLGRAGREARLGDLTLPALLALPVVELRETLERLPPSAVWESLRPGLALRLERMARLGLGHLSLDRVSTSLSGGEAQRVRLVAQLTAGLGRMLVAMDEPTLGLHPESQPGMRAVLDELRGLGNTLVVVEHDPDMVRNADVVVQVGPGAGPDGGRIVSMGATPPDPLGPPPRPRPRRAPGDLLVLRGATLHNLEDADLRVVLGALNVVLGPSGAGKSSLVFGTLLPALQGKAGGAFRALDGVPEGLVVRAVDASAIGSTPRSTPATWTGLFDLVRARFAATEAARARGWKAGRFSYNNKAGRCPRCEGLGFERIGLHLLEDVELPCPVCGGGRYAEETRQVRLRGRDIAQVLAMSVTEALEFFADDLPIARLLRALDTLGLGYLELGQSSTTLSRGEAQRVKLAALLGTPSSRPSLVLMDEPDRGLHPDDLRRLLGALDALVEAGHTVLAISHHRHLWAAADHRVGLREGVVSEDPPMSWGPLSQARGAVEPDPAPSEIHLVGVRTHNLADLELRLPHERITVIAGVSGGGKSSLAFDTIAAEGLARFAESLPFQVRRFMRRVERPVLDGASGLGPTVALRQGQTRAGRRSTVATQSGLGPLLRLLWARAGRPGGFSAAHFSANRPLGACPDCEGLGVVSRCDPARLVREPGLPLAGGAMAGTAPGRFFGEPDGQHMATLAAAGVDVGRPWAELSSDEQRLALRGAGDAVFAVRWRYRRGKREGEHRFEGPWPGLCALVEREARLRARRKDAAAWAEPLVEVPCETCGGQRLRPALRAVKVQGRSLPELRAMPLSQVRAWSSGLDGAVGAALGPELRGRVEDLCALGLGHLSLDRTSRSLSTGELQRVRLASVLRSGLTGLTLVLDEPAAGLHPRDLEHLLERLRTLRDEGNTVIVVSHRPALIRGADHLIELGPGAGAEGGRIIAQGSPAEVLAGEGPTARALRRPVLSVGVRGEARLRVRGARAHNLRALDLTLPGEGFVAVIGVSGSGKSSLIFDVIEATARAGRAVGCDAIEGLSRFEQVLAPRRGERPPVTALGLLPPVQSLFHAASPELPKRAFSFHSPAGRCPVCRGTGRERVSMDFLADLDLPCPACQGRRYRPEVLAVRWQGLDIATFLDTPVAALAERLPPGRLRRGVSAMERVGLGHLALGRPSRTLSGGEAQRLTLAASLLARGGPTLFLLDEPATGLHEQDLARLVSVFQELAARGDLIIAAEHRLSLIRAADHVIELGPEGGPGGGALVAQTSGATSGV